MIALLLLTCSSFTLGHLVIRRLNLRPVSRTESVLFSLGIGMGLWCLMLFLLGHAGLFYPRLLMGIAAAVSLPGPFLLYREWRSFSADYQQKDDISLQSNIFLAVAGVVLALIFISSFAPVTGGICNDELCTHLSIPKEWLRHHGIVVLPYAVSYQAGNAHLLFLLTSCFNQESGPRLVSWLCFILCLGGVYTISRHFLNRNGAIIAVLTAVVNPLVFRAGNIAFVDLESALFTILPLCALLSYQKEKRMAWLILCGFFMGIGCGIKPTNIIYSAVTIFVATVAFFFSSRNILQSLRKTLLLGTLTALFASPWPVRNLVLTGSPTFPPPLALYQTWGPKPLSGKAVPYSYKEIKEYYDYCLSRYGVYRRNAVSFARFPWDLTMQPERFQIGDSVGTLLLSFLPLVFLFFPLPRIVWFLLGFASISGVLLYFAVLPESRYYIGCIMALGPVIAYAVTMLCKNTYARPIVTGVIAINLLFSLGVAIRITTQPIRAALNPDFRRQYCEEGIPYFEAFDYLRTHSVDTVLVKAPERIYYYLHGAYKVDPGLDHPDSSHIGRIALEIDYSQVLGRSAGRPPGGFTAGSKLPDNTRLLLDRSDARIYTFTAPVEGKGH